MLKKYAVVCILIFVFFLFLSVASHAAPICGDGVKEGWEECDNASANSDSAPNACRSNCVMASCGDYAVDNGEECDDFPNNSDQIPNACRRDCRRAHCGDGVLDSGEQCDDKNNDAYDGCHQCKTCYLLKDDLVLSGNPGDTIRICPGRYDLQDNGQEGVLIIKGSEVNVDLSGVILVGVALSLKTAGQAKSTVQDAKQIVIQSASKGHLRGNRGKNVQATTVNTPSQDQGGSGSLPQMPAATIKQGVGIIVQGSNVVLHDVGITSFRQGIKLQSSGAVLFNNKVCGNSTDILSEQSGNFGVKNSCNNQQGWQENGQNGCTVGCN